MPLDRIAGVGDTASAIVVAKRLSRIDAVRMQVWNSNSGAARAFYWHCHKQYKQ